MKSAGVVVSILCLALSASAQWLKLPNAPQPQPSQTQPAHTVSEYGAGFSFDNQLYALQGGAVSMIVGTLTYRPWLGLASGVGSCALYRAIHDQYHRNDALFGYHRMEFCAAGAVGTYGLMKLLHVHRPLKKGWHSYTQD